MKWAKYIYHTSTGTPGSKVLLSWRRGGGGSTRACQYLDARQDSKTKSKKTKKRTPSLAIQHTCRCSLVSFVLCLCLHMTRQPLHSKATRLFSLGLLLKSEAIRTRQKLGAGIPGPELLLFTSSSTCIKKYEALLPVT